MGSIIVPYHPKMKIIVDLIHCLYELPGCGCGGCCHIVTDDNNLLNSDLKEVIRFCNESKQSDRIDRELSTTICVLLLQLTLGQRVFLFQMFEENFLNNGIDEDIWENWWIINHDRYDSIINNWVDLVNPQDIKYIDGKMIFCEE